MNPTDLLLWMHLREHKPPEHERFVVGCDISMGLSVTNSAASIACQTTWEKVGRYATARLSPEKFAEEVVALCTWLNGAYLIWEMNGPGLQFGKRVIELGYLNVYYRTNEASLSRKQSDTPGWSASRDNRRLLFGDYCAALSDGRFVNRDEASLLECRQFVMSSAGEITNVQEKSVGDPYGAGVNHADIATADALACKGLMEIGPSRPQREEAKTIPAENVTSFMGRRRAREEMRNKEVEW